MFGAERNLKELKSGLVCIRLIISDMSCLLCSGVVIPAVIHAVIHAIIFAVILASSVAVAALLIPCLAFIVYLAVIFARRKLRSKGLRFSVRFSNKQCILKTAHIAY